MNLVLSDSRLKKAVHIKHATVMSVSCIIVIEIVLEVVVVVAKIVVIDAHVV